MSENIEKKEFKPALFKAMDLYLPLVIGQLEQYQIKMSEYAKKCVISAASTIHRMVADSGNSWSDLDQSNVVDILSTVADYELNPLAQPREVYFSIRKKKINLRDKESGKVTETWTKLVELGIEGDGNDRLLSRFGRNVSVVHPRWEVREEDGFTYPKRKGLAVTDPEWEPTGIGKCVRVVYPITFTDGRTEYFISERAEVLNNLMAHLSNNLMNETFGLAENRYKATPDQKKKIEERKNEIFKKALELNFDLLDDPSFAPYLSPAWQSPYSREQMIIRKMRNNIAKRIPKDFSTIEAANNFEHAENGSVKPVIEADFSEIGITQTADEQKRLDALNQLVGGGAHATDQG